MGSDVALRARRIRAAACCWLRLPGKSISAISVMEAAEDRRS